MKREDGFTLVEVLVAGALIVFVVMAVATMSLTAKSQIDRSGERTAAAILGQQRIEWLRNQSYTSADLAAGTTTEDLTGTYAGFTRTTGVEDNVPRGGLKRVSVTVQTPSGASLALVSLIAE